MAAVRSVPTTSISMMACLVKTMLHTAMRADARRMITNANISLYQVHPVYADVV